MIRKWLERAMRHYEGADPIIRMKAKLFFLIYLLILFILPLAIAYSAISHLHNPTLGYRLNFLILIPEALALLPLLGIFVLLLRGRFSLSAHLLLVSLFLVTWIVMLLDRSGELSRLDTIVFVLGILTLTPLAVVRRKGAILLYGGGNLALFLIFILHARGQLEMPFHRYMEYIADNVVAFVFITLTAFSVFVINQRALERMKGELAERRRQESEKERLQAQLVHAQKMESVGRLAGGVAHDFNNLLTTIMGNAGLAIAKLDAGSPAATRLRDIMRAAESAAALTRQLLTFSRGQATEPRLIDLDRHVRRIVRLLERLIGEDIRIVLKTEAGSASIMADPGQVEQVVINLAVNSRDAMPRGGTVTIATSRERIDASPPGANPIMEPGNYVALSVNDTGCGISEHDIPRIFDPFFTTKPVGKGTGLGLAAVYGAVQQNRGAITVKSEPGHGTTMTVYFPAASGTARVEAQEFEELPRGSESLLLVEDEPALIDFMRLILSGLGYRVQAAADGASALALIGAGTRFDLLLSNVILSDMTGATLAARAQALIPGAGILCMSGQVEKGIARDGVADRGVHFIAKPFTAQELAKKVRQVLDSRQ
ncbi:MAG: response regulator [Candidatus Aminicenantes bacterium]|nr:response regulator [Candidatus Aminicenantes bacterium]